MSSGSRQAKTKKSLSVTWSLLSRRNFLISSLEDCTPNSGCSADSFRHTIIGMRLGGPPSCASISRIIELAMTKLFKLGMCGLLPIEASCYLMFVLNQLQLMLLWFRVYSLNVNLSQ